jgi:hypothetical protein
LRAGGLRLKPAIAGWDFTIGHLQTDLGLFSGATVGDCAQQIVLPLVLGKNLETAIAPIDSHVCRLSEEIGAGKDWFCWRAPVDYP